MSLILDWTLGSSIVELLYANNITNTHTHAHTYIFSHTHTHTLIYKHIHTYIHMWEEMNQI